MRKPDVGSVTRWRVIVEMIAANSRIPARRTSDER
jgi:hypothetical protein